LQQAYLLHFLPPSHHASATTKTHVLPHIVEIAVVDGADEGCAVGKRGQVVAGELMVMFGHGIGEAPDDGFGDICVTVLA